MTLCHQTTYIVLGLGISGRAAIDFLLAKKLPVKLVATNLTDDAVKYYREIGVEVYRQSEGFDWSDVLLKTVYPLLVVSPGISPQSKILSDTRLSGVKRITDIDLFFYFLSPEQRKNIVFVGVTGTNGKTSVVELINAMFNRVGMKSAVAGNIGNSPLELFGQINDLQAIVFELSSFQLFYSTYINIDVSVLTSFSEDHIDWHGSIEEYKKAKLKIINCLSNSKYHAIVSSRCSFDYFGNFLPPNVDVVSELEFVRESPLFSEHTLIEKINISLASKVVNAVLNRELTKEEWLFIEKFQFPRYRCEKFYFPNSNSLFINDSKSTNLESTIVALEEIKEPVHLLLGGIAKNPNFSPLNKYKSKILKISLFGRDGQRIAESLRETDLEPLSKVYSSLKQAIDSIEKQEQTGVQIPVLFSPGCASFDEFSGYKERGEYVVTKLGLIKRFKSL